MTKYDYLPLLSVSLSTTLVFKLTHYRYFPSFETKPIIWV